MGRLFFAFPGGVPGVALLLLRAVLGLTVMVQGGLYVQESDPTPAAWFVGLAALAAGGLLTFGFLTPVVPSILIACAVSVGLLFLPANASKIFDSRMPVIFGLTMLATIAGLGPGAYSVDARVFGRREIIIPLPPSRLAGPDTDGASIAASLKDNPAARLRGR